MKEYRYRLIYDNDIIADNITIDTAILLIKVLCEEHFAEPKHSFQLIEMTFKMEIETEK